jgi:hypothetical protein
MPRHATLVLLAASLALAACERSGWRISQRLAVAVESATTTIDMTEVAPFDWDRMCVLGPYSGPRQAREVLGFDWAVEDKSDIGSLDTMTLIVFVQGRDVVAYAEHPRGQGDLAALRSRCLERGAARLIHRPSPEDRMQLVAEGEDAKANAAEASAEPVAPPASSASSATGERRP